MSILGRIKLTPAVLSVLLDVAAVLFLVAGTLVLLGAGAALIGAGLASLVLAWRYGP